MRTVCAIFLSISFVLLLSACNDTSKTDELNKTNAAAKKSSQKEEYKKKEAEAFDRVINEPMNKTKF